jgi:hypothetical protein
VNAKKLKKARKLARMVAATGDMPDRQLLPRKYPPEMGIEKGVTAVNGAKTVRGLYRSLKRASA